LSATGTWTIWSTTYDTGTSLDFDLTLTCDGVSEPDLSVQVDQVDPTTVVSGGMLTLDATVSNVGEAPAASSTIRYRLSNDSTISPQDPALASGAITSLGAGDESAVSVDLRAPAVAGNYWIGACVAPVEGESVEENNCSNAVQITITENNNACTDLAIACGETLAGAFDIGDCDDSPRGAGYFARSYTFAGSAGDTVIVQAEWTGDGYLYLESPSGSAVAQNDDAGSPTQSEIVYNLDAAGNWKIWTTSADIGESMDFDLTLECELSAQPDLVISTPEVANDVVRFGEAVELSTTVLNQGSGTSGASSVRFLASTDATISPLDRVLRTVPVAALAPSAQSLETASPYVLLDEGTWWIGACVDAVAGETDTLNNCSDGLEITVEPGETIPFVPELNDGWYDPATNGQGFFINVFPDRQEIFLSWFTYELERPDASVPASLGEPGHRWLTAQGVYSNDRASLVLHLTEGGLFNTSPPQPTTRADGEIQLAFNSCGVGIVTYSIESLNLQGEVVIQRLAPDNIQRCEDKVAAVEQAAPSAQTEGKAPPVLPRQDGEFHINPGLNDAWFFPGTDGQGFFINVFPDRGDMFLSWFTYDTERPDPSIEAQIGEPGHRWLTAQGAYAGSEAVLGINIAEGGVFDDSPPEPELRRDGSIVVEFSDCNNGLVTFNIPSISVSGEVPIERLTLDNVALCEELNAAQEYGAE
jgi:hypothetical protein